MEPGQNLLSWANAHGVGETTFDRARTTRTFANHPLKSGHMGTANGHDVFNNVLFLIALAVVCLGALSMVASPIHWAVARPARKRQAKQVSKPIGPSFRTAGVMKGYATVANGAVLPDGRVKAMYQGPIRPGPSRGSLPVVIDMEGLGGERSGVVQPFHTEGWVFRATEVVLANESDEWITCRVWLVVDLPNETMPFRELMRVPNDPVWLEPRKPTRFDLEFHLPLVLADEETRLNPGSAPRELVFVEIGPKARELRVPFGPPKSESERSIRFRRLRRFRAGRSKA